MSKIIIGTCSWKYDSWKGIIYPHLDEINYLQEYSKHFKSVEVDQWFWSLFKIIKLPDKKSVDEYKKSVPKDFKFTIKVPNSITLTHYYNRGKSAPLQKNPHFMSVDLFGEFLQTMKPIKNQIGSLIFQFEYLNKQKMSSLSEFQKHLHQFFTSLPADIPPLSIEIRNPNYISTNYFIIISSFRQI